MPGAKRKAIDFDAYLSRRLKNLEFRKKYEGHGNKLKSGQGKVMKRFDLITIFPQSLDSYFGTSILKRAQAKKLIKIQAHDLRKWTRDKHRKTDDKPYGGDRKSV